MLDAMEMPCIVYLLPLILLAGSTSTSPVCYLAYFLVDLLTHPPCPLCALACALMMFAFACSRARMADDPVLHQLIAQIDAILEEH